MYSLIKQSFVFYILLIFASYVNNAYRKEAYKFFDKFILFDIVSKCKISNYLIIYFVFILTKQLNLFTKQLADNQCLPNQGPNCVFINGEEYLNNNSLVKAISNDIDQENIIDNIPILLNRVKELKNKYTSNNSIALNQVFSVSPKIQMNLLLNFESYEVTTKYEDILLQEEKIINFNIGKLVLNFIGKVVITQERKDGKPLPYNKNVSPYSTYGIIKSDSKSYINIYLTIT